MRQYLIAIIRKVIGTLFLLYFLASSSQEPIHYFLGKDIFSGVELYSIIQDEDNSMWISSNKGIFHYNGINFEKIPVNNSKRDAFFGLTKDNNNGIYFFNFSGQVFKIKNKKITLFYTLPKKFLSKNLNLKFDNLNNLIINSSSRLVVVNSDTKKATTTADGGAFLIKKNDTLYYGKTNTRNKTAIIGRYNSTETVFKNFPRNQDSRIAVFSKLFFHKNKLYTFDANKNNFHLIKNNSVEKIPLQLPKNNYYRAFYSSNNFWFTTMKNGVYRVNPKNFNATSALNKWFKEYRISGVYTDFENNTWLLTFDNGIIIIPKLNVSSFRIENDKISEIEKINNRIYVSTKESAIYNFKNKTFFPYFKGKNDRFESFNIFEEKGIITSSTSVYKGSNKLKNIIIFNRGTVLVNDSIFVALHAGLHKFDIKTNKTTQLNIRRTFDICLSPKKDKIYISSINGLLIYNFFNISSPIKHNGKNIEPRRFTAVNDEVWVSSKQGIYILKEDETIKTLTTKDGLLSNNIENIKYEYPYIYITNAKGIQQYNLETKTFSNILEDYRLTKSIKNFEVLNDTIYATTSNGLAVFSFNDITNSVLKYRTNITEAITNGNKNFKNNTSLKPNENNVSFSFLTTSYKYQKKLDYYYQLIGNDKKPIKAKDGQYIVNYSNLAPGNYTFKVYSSLYKQKNYTDSFTFSVQQHWYKTNWFKAFAICFLVLMLYAIYFNRLKVIERKQKQEEFKKVVAESSLTSLKAQMNPHFLFNTINSVQSLILKEKKDDAYSYLTKLSQLIRKTLNMSDKTWVYLDEEIQQIRNYLDLEKLRFNNDFAFNIRIDEHLETLKIPSMIIQPFVENAIKHGLLHKDHEKELYISFNLKNELLNCIIEDNGVGREASNQINNLKPSHQKSFSTNAIEKRFKLYQEYLNINAGFIYEDLSDNRNNPTGTRVTINIPYLNDED